MIKAILIYLAVSLAYCAGFVTCALLSASREDDEIG